MMEILLTKVKKNLILTHSDDDSLLEGFITAATSYAESYQKKPEEYYKENPMHPTTEQAIIMLSSIFMKAGMEARVVFSPIVWQPVSRFGMWSTCFLCLIRMW